MDIYYNPNKLSKKKLICKSITIHQQHKTQQQHNNNTTTQQRNNNTATTQPNTTMSTYTFRVGLRDDDPLELLVGNSGLKALQGEVDIQWAKNPVTSETSEFGAVRFQVNVSDMGGQVIINGTNIHACQVGQKVLEARLAALRSTPQLLTPGIHEAVNVQITYVQKGEDGYILSYCGVDSDSPGEDIWFWLPNQRSLTIGDKILMDIDVFTFNGERIKKASVSVSQPLKQAEMKSSHDRVTKEFDITVDDESCTPINWEAVIGREGCHTENIAGDLEESEGQGLYITVIQTQPHAATVRVSQNKSYSSLIPGSLLYEVRKRIYQRIYMCVRD